MSSEIRDEVIPFLKETLETLDEVEGAQGLVTPAELNQRFVRSLERLERRLGHLDVWDSVRYALVSWVDSSVKDARRWQYHKLWQDDQTLEYRIYRTTDCATQFFDESFRMRDAQRGAAMEVFLICGLLGFRGIYGTQLRDKILASHPGFPRSFPTWAEQMAGRIRTARPPRPLVDRPVPADPAVPLRGRESLGNMAMIFGIAASLVLALAVHRLIDPPDRSESSTPTSATAN